MEVREAPRAVALTGTSHNMRRQSVWLDPRPSCIKGLDEHEEIPVLFLEYCIYKKVISRKVSLLETIPRHHSYIQLLLEYQYDSELADYHENVESDRL